MRGVRSVALWLLLLPLGGLLTGCDSMDTFSIFDTKKKLPGVREPVFPEGVPGVTQGIPPELVKGYQEQSTQTAAASSTDVAGQPQAKPPEGEQTAKNEQPATNEHPAAKKKHVAKKAKPKPKHVAAKKPAAVPVEPQSAAQTASAPVTEAAAPAPAPWPSAQPAKPQISW